MINQLHALFHRPEKGWDPVPPEHASYYARAEWEKFDETEIDKIEDYLGRTVAGLRILDLGGGPGHYSVAFAQRGAAVTWHDISRSYLDFSRAKASAAGVDGGMLGAGETSPSGGKVGFSLGYLEEASRFKSVGFDLVFNRLCWCYSKSDRFFARMIYGLVRPGGACYIDTNTSHFSSLSKVGKVKWAINRVTGIKIGHPHPAKGQVMRLIRKYPMERLVEDNSSPNNDRLFFVKAGS